MARLRDNEEEKPREEGEHGLTLGGLPAPHFWRKQENDNGSIMWHHDLGEPITVTEAIYEKDNQQWLSLLITKGERAATITDARKAMHLFIGEERECYIVFPKGKIDNRTIKVVCCLDKANGVLPAFE